MSDIFALNTHLRVSKGSVKDYSDYKIGHKNLFEALSDYLDSFWPTKGYEFISTYSKEIEADDSTVLTYELLIKLEIYKTTTSDSIDVFCNGICNGLVDIYKKYNALYDIIKNVNDSSANNFIQNGGGYRITIFLKDLPIPPLPIANFIINYDPNQFPTEIKIINQSKNSVKYLYDFGDGEKSSISEPNKIYTTEGNYNILLTTLSSNNSSSTFSQSIIIKKIITPDETIQPSKSEESDSKPQNQVDKTSNVNEKSPDEKAKNINIKLPNDPDLQNEFIRGTGFTPVIYYNSLLIDNSYIDYFTLYNDGFIPCIKLNFNDSSGMIKSKLFPLDDTKIKIFISSRSKNLKSIILDFKITKFHNLDGLMIIDGILHSSKLYTKNYNTYQGSSSYNALKKISSDIGIGFNSNVNDTNDQMNWLQNGKRFSDFIESIVERSYISDKTFLSGYIDYHQCFNYIDIEKEMERDISEQHGVSTSGLEEANETNNSIDLHPLILTNDESMSQSNGYFSKFRIVNKSSEISSDTGYIQNSNFYDRNKKELVTFKIDSITKNEGSKIILKGDPNDPNSAETIKNNQNYHYMGKLDTSNVHNNYFYTKINNWKNIVDLGKIEINIEMGNPNFNIYQFQKINLMLSNNSPMGGDDSMVNSRLSGEWLVIDIDFILTKNKFTQNFRLVKRELELSKEELNAVKNNTNTSNNIENHASKNTTNPEPNSNTTGTPALVDYNTPVKPTKVSTNNNSRKKTSDINHRIKTSYSATTLIPIYKSIGVPYGIILLFIAQAYSEGFGTSISGIETSKNVVRRGNNPGAYNYDSSNAVSPYNSTKSGNGYALFPTLLQGANYQWNQFKRILEGKNSSYKLAKNSPLWNNVDTQGYTDTYLPVSDKRANNDPHQYAIQILEILNAYDKIGYSTDNTLNDLFNMKS